MLLCRMEPCLLVPLSPRQLVPLSTRPSKLYNKMAKRELTARYLFFIAGLFVNAFGISLIIKANLGSSPISSLPYTLSLKFPITLGQFTLLLNAVLIAGQIALLKKDFRKEQFLQIPVAILFSFFIDCSMALLSVSPLRDTLHRFYHW